MTVAAAELVPGVVDGDWVLYAGVALMLVFTAGEIYYLRRSSREQG